MFHFKQPPGPGHHYMTQSVRKEVSGPRLRLVCAMVKFLELDICASCWGHLKEEGFLDSGTSISTAATLPVGRKRTWSLKKVRSTMLARQLTLGLLLKLWAHKSWLIPTWRLLQVSRVRYMKCPAWCLNHTRSSINDYRFPPPSPASPSQCPL